MVIVRLSGGLGNQVYQYAAGRYLAYKLDTELKIDLGPTSIGRDLRIYQGYYVLGYFNIIEEFATAEEIKRVNDSGTILGTYQDYNNLNSNLSNFQGDVFVHGTWMMGAAAFIDVCREEFTLKNSLSPSATAWKEKILSAEYSVSIHIRHGEKIYTVREHGKPWVVPLPLDYYYTCIDILKQKCSNLTVFCFSDNIPWCKENLHLDVLTEFVDLHSDASTKLVEGYDPDIEEWILMSLCKCNIVANSTFSSSAAFVNSNPDKKMFQPNHHQKTNAEQVQQFVNSLTPAKKAALLSATRITVPFDFYNLPEIKVPPFYSILLVVNDDIATISETLYSILNQDYKYYEVIIIDNASTDGSGKVCRQAIEGRDNVIFKRLSSKVPNAKAWNKAFTWAEGYYVFFLKGNDCFLANTLTTLYLNCEYKRDIFHLFTWLVEHKSGSVIFGDKKYSENRDAFFQAQAKSAIPLENGQEATKLLINQQINRFLGTKIYNRDFLTKNKIKFDKQLPDDEAELFFQMECFFKSRHFMYVPKAVYIVPEKYFPDFTARVDIVLLPTTNKGDFQILSVSDTIAKVNKADWMRRYTAPNAIAYVITSFFGKLKFVAKATTDGQVRFWLRTLYVPDPKVHGKSIYYWIDYTKLTINGNLIFDKLTPTWHDKPYYHNMDVKAGDEITVEVEWLPHS